MRIALFSDIHANLPALEACLKSIVAQKPDAIYCLNCRVVYHEGKTCDEYQKTAKLDDNDEKFITYVQGSKFKQCPHCNFWVERTQGCDHMKCRCGKDFCYKCGGVYGDCECQRIRRE